MIESSIGALCARVAAKPDSCSTVPSRTARAIRPASKSALRPMNTAARPTRLWKPATSSGICVICTRAATMAPATPPRAIISTISQVALTPGARIVARMASAMPTMPYQMARLAFSWLESPPSARMKRTAAAM